MTRGPTMSETRWSMGTTTPGDINDVESTSAAPPISSYRRMYRHSLPAASAMTSGGQGVSPEHATTTSMGEPARVFESPDAFGFSPTSDWTYRNQHNPVDLARVQIKPNATNSVSTSEPDIFKRSVNEGLHKYMVIRQRTFHGLMRSKSDLRRLPLTDPRETMSEGSTPTWLHRSKTDLYIEKWRSKSKTRERSQGGSSALDLSGMTLGSLYESLPGDRSRKSLSLPSGTSRKEVKFEQPSSSTPPVQGVVSNGSETRFPPLPSSSVRRSSSEQPRRSSSGSEASRLGVGTTKLTSHTPSPTHTIWSSASPKKTTPPQQILVLPSEHEDEKALSPKAPMDSEHEHTRIGGVSDEPTKMEETKASTSQSPPAVNDASKGPAESETSPRTARCAKRKMSRKTQSLAAIPLQVWEPSFECVVVGSQNVLQPRHLARAWQNTSAIAEQNALK